MQNCQNMIRENCLDALCWTFGRQVNSVLLQWLIYAKRFDFFNTCQLLQKVIDFDLRVSLHCQAKICRYVKCELAVVLVLV